MISSANAILKTCSTREGSKRAQMQHRGEVYPGETTHRFLQVAIAIRAGSFRRVGWAMHKPEPLSSKVKNTSS